MKRVIYATILIFTAIMITAAIISLRNPPRTVEYRDGEIFEN